MPNKKIEELKNHLNKQISLSVTLTYENGGNSIKVFNGLLNDVKREKGVYRAYLSNCLVSYVHSKLNVFEKTVDCAISGKGFSFKINENI